MEKFYDSKAPEKGIQDGNLPVGRLVDNWTWEQIGGYK
jgi:hypothetical protein